MRYSEVETLFHEFGHGLHGLMTQIDYPTFSESTAHAITLSFQHKARALGQSTRDVGDVCDAF